MNSWKSSALGACTPPFRTLKCGTGSDGVTPSGVSHCHSGIPAAAASARASAIETPTVALAPSRLLFGGAVQVDHGLVRVGQRGPGPAAEQAADLGVDGRDRAQDALALVAVRVAVAALDRFPGSGGGAGGDPGPGGRAVGQPHGHRQRRPAA